EYLEEFKKFNGAVDLIYDISEYFEPAKPSDDLVGKKLEFETTDIDGNKITSEEIFAENEYTMLNIWATWCGYCVRELPELEAINERISGKNCAVVGLLGDGETDETIKSGKALLDEAGVTYLNILPWEGALSKDLQIEAWPTTFYVDKDGVITDTVIVGAETDKYEPAIDSLLKKNKK
ncbi:MAG: TlpA family protein disulfide reductase, partial [Lachnospiraceae bacterium]|nr:TlpA family protein disulfide reductase [Lachnospiraceae bacterium]